LQGPGLLIVAPLIVCFFAGGAVLSIVLSRAELVPAWNPWLHAAALGAAVGGGALASAGLVLGRIVGLTVLALFSVPQVLAGFAVRLQPDNSVGFSRAPVRATVPPAS